MSAKVASTGAIAGDDTVSSPYPKDPWLSVPAEPETPTPPLFRAAVDSVYGTAAAEELPETEAEAGEWLEKASPPASLGKDDSLEPLKPLPRPDDTDSYLLAKLEVDSSSETVEELPWPEPPAWPKPAEEAKQDEPVEEEDKQTWPTLQWTDPEPLPKPEPEPEPELAREPEPKVEPLRRFRPVAEEPEFTSELRQPEPE
ncbi:MAG: hypothetical protein HOY71_25680, partial [Nonomuraea sp.]|nr:hypothetical protein [Nonomuraea sp.]